MHNNFLLTAINAKYIHSNLAIRYIKEFCKTDINSINITEFSINDSYGNILKELYNSGCNVFAFSCYIWNTELILKLCNSIKKVLPYSTIIIGGPEVSFDCHPLLTDNPAIDYVIMGEGELTFLELAKYINGEITDLHNINGIAYRQQDNICINNGRIQIDNLDILPFPYNNISELENKIIYYETSRGCPFNCQYCLSSTIKGIRFFSLERVKSDIDYFINNNVKQVKLVDRTFNCDRQRSIDIMQYIIDLNPKTNFHFEIAADLINDEFINVLSKAPKGLFQFEVGVQSTNLNTLYEINRKMNFEKVRNNVSKILELHNAHVHLDLIAGLPFEDFESFKRSFNDTYYIKPNMLQLGFLKLLKGSGIRKKAVEYKIQYNEHAPYEVLCTKWMSYNELLKLKDIEHLLEVYHNSGRFCNSLDYLLNNYYHDPFSFFTNFSNHWTDEKHYNSPKSLNALCTILYEYIIAKHGYSLEFNEIMKFDWIIHSGNSNIPSIIKRYDHTAIKNKLHSYIKESSDILTFANTFILTDAKNILKNVSFEVFKIDLNSKSIISKPTILFFLKNPTGDFEYLITSINDNEYICK